MTKKAALLAALLPLFFASTVWGQSLFSRAEKRSILGNQRNDYYAILESTAPVTRPEPSASAAPHSISTGGVYDLLVPTATAAGQAGDELLRYLDQKKAFSYSRDRWLKMRRSVVEGIKEERKEGIIASSGIAKPAAEPLPPGLAVELPYESQLFISGRKLIGVSMKSTIYDKPESNRRVNSSSFDMTQELQVRIKGRVGRKINVNVDFDDTRDDKRDISVVYKGDPDEVVQEAAFGDIAMSLPSTEFVGYSRQLFGVKVDTKYKGLRTQGFFSRTKGFSEVKRFSGNTRFERRTISDTSYITLKYYSLRPAGAIKSGSVIVYRDDLNSTNNANIAISSSTVLHYLLLPATHVYTGSFDRLVPGQDYTVDYLTGILSFRNKVASNHVIAVHFDDGSGRTTPEAPLIIKDINNSAQSTTELKTFYSLGNVKIIRDNGRGNFLLKIQDLNGGTPADINGGPVPAYPSGANFLPRLSVDFENGVFNIEQDPFQKVFPDDLYTLGTHRYNFLTEYRYRIKILNLRPGIVPQSERVTMDGKVLKNNEDYFIDYDAGILTLFNEDRITESTVVDVSYDYAPFGSAGGSTLIGLRSELSLTRDFFIGSSFIYDFSAKTQAVPDIRTTPSSLAVGEVDARVQNIEIPGTPLKVSLSGEVAQSQQNPNIMGKAIVESMEGIKMEESASLYYESWRYGATPSFTRYESTDIKWSNEDVYKRDISTSTEIEKDEKQQILNIDYDLRVHDRASIVQSFSTSGLDFSKKQFIEMWVRGNYRAGDPQTFLAVEYGTFNEDVDVDAVTNPRPDTEDRNEDGTLNAGEDIGWNFNEPVPTEHGSATAVGANNGRLDTEDLNGNGILDTFDNTPGAYGPSDGRTAFDAEGNPHTFVDWNGWKLLKIPLNITNAEEWKYIRQVRLTLSANPAESARSRLVGRVSVASLSTTGNRWDPDVASVGITTVTISAVNNETPGYSPLGTNPDYQSLYGDEGDDEDRARKREQALSIKYRVLSSTENARAGAKLVYTGRAYDLSNYNNLRLFLHCDPLTAGDTFFIQAGGSDANYYEYRIPITQDLINRAWSIISIRQAGQSARADHWVIEGGGNGAVTAIVGAPSLQNISQIKVGVYANGGAMTPSDRDREIWVNEIHVTEARAKTGTAWRANADFTLPGMGRFGALAFGMGRKEIGRDFQTFSAGVYNRDYLEDNGYVDFRGLDLVGITLVPFNAKLNRTRTVTPSVVQNQNDLLSIYDEGRVTTYQGSFGTSLSLRGYLPNFSGQYTRGITDSQQIRRLEDRETMTGTMDYQNPLRFALLPTAVQANYSLSNSYFRVYPSTRIIDSNAFLDPAAANEYLQIKDYHTLEITESWGMKTPFTPWQGFNFSPAYNVSRIREKNRDFAPAIEYPKSLNQDVSANSSLKIFNWMQPTLNYSINTRENYNLTMSTQIGSIKYPSETKFIERSSNGEVTWNFQVRDVTSARSLQSLNFTSSYRIQDSDSYDNVESSFSAVGASADRLWIRGNNLKPLTSGTTELYTVKSIVQKDDIRVAGRYNPLEALALPGRLAALKTLTANFTYTGSDEHSYITGTQRDVYTRVWPDLILGMSRWETIAGLEQWVSDTQLNLRHQRKTVETAAVSFSESRSYGADWRFMFIRKYDINFAVTRASNEDRDLILGRISGQGESFAWSTSGGFTRGPWRFSLRYENSQDWHRDALGKLSSQLFTDSYTGQANADMSFPRGLPLPFTRRTLPLTNRFIFNSTVKYVAHRSSLNVERDNNTNYGLSSTGEYEVSQNFRLSMGLAWERFQYKDNPNENYTTIEASSRLTIQF